MVLFGLLIHQIENSLRPRHGHNDTVGLLADLADRLGGVFVQCQERNQGAQGQPRESIQCQHRAYHRTKHVADVAQIGVNRHGDVGKGIGAVGAVPQLPVQAAELLQALFLMAEDLDHLLAVHHLLDVPVDPAQILLLSSKIDGRFPRDPGGDRQHDTDHGQGQKGQGNVQNQHAGKGGDNGDQRVDDLGNALADQLSERIHVVGINRHDVSVGMGVKIADRQGFHMPEQLDAEIAHGSLAHIDHNPVIGVGADDPYEIRQRQGKQGPSQGGEVRRLGLGQRQDIIID